MSVISLDNHIDERKLARAERRKRAKIFGYPMAKGVDETLKWPIGNKGKVVPKYVRLPPPARVVYRSYTKKSKAGVKYTNYAKFIQRGTYKTK